MFIHHDYHECDQLPGPLTNLNSIFSPVSCAHLGIVIVLGVVFELAEAPGPPVLLLKT